MNVEHIRKDFPIFQDPTLVYLDSAASAQKPRAVIQSMTTFYERGYANIHRGVYSLSEKATLEYDEVRGKISRFLGANAEEEVIFTHGTTEGVNLVARAWGDANLGPGDEILLTLFEHHANFVPWQELAKRTGANIRYLLPAADEGFSLDAFRALLSPKTKLVAVTQLANALGIAPPISEIIPLAHAVGARVLVDGAQGVSHFPTDLKKLGVDFYVFSGHKLYGPTGIGVLVAKMELLEHMPPFLTGGDMIRHVSVEGTSFAEPPARFEAGTPHIAGVIGLGAAIDYVESVGRDAVARHEDALIQFAEDQLATIPEIRVLGPRGQHKGLLVFDCRGVHPHDVAQALAADGVCIRAGHHCNQPLHHHFSLQATSRMSVGMYTTEEDIRRGVESLRKAIRFFAM